MLRQFLVIYFLDDKEEIKFVSEIVASVGTTIKFNNLCDFQFLPAIREQVCAVWLIYHRWT